MRKKAAKWKGIFFLLPSFFGVCLFWLVPYIDVIRRSFFGAVSGISACCKKHSSFFCSMYSTTCVFIPGSGCFYIRAETLSSDDKKFLFAAYGNPGCFCCSFVEAYVSRPGTFKPFSFLFLHRRTGLHEYGKFFLCTGIQLYMEKSGIRHCTLACGAFSN